MGFQLCRSFCIVQIENVFGLLFELRVSKKDFELHRDNGTEHLLTNSWWSRGLDVAKQNALRSTKRCYKAAEPSCVCLCALEFGCWGFYQGGCVFMCGQGGFLHGGFHCRGAFTARVSTRGGFILGRDIARTYGTASCFYSCQQELCVLDCRWVPVQSEHALSEFLVNSKKNHGACVAIFPVLNLMLNSK